MSQANAAHQKNPSWRQNDRKETLPVAAARPSAWNRSPHPPNPPFGAQRPVGSSQQHGQSVGVKVEPTMSSSVLKLDPSLSQDAPHNAKSNLHQETPVPASSKRRKTTKRKPTVPTLGELIPDHIWSSSKKSPPVISSLNANSLEWKPASFAENDFPALNTSHSVAPRSADSLVTPSPVRILKKDEPIPPLKKPSPTVKLPAADEKSPKVAGKEAPPGSKMETPSKKTKSLSTLDSSNNKMRDMQGVEHELMRLMQTNKVIGQKKGRQRIKPRKKKLTSLKKKVLLERLRRWRELHPDNDESTLKTDHLESSTVCLFEFTEPDELEDDAEYEEICSNLHEMATRIGRVRRSYVPRPSDSAVGDERALAVFVEFQSSSDADAAVQCWNGLVLGGTSIKCCKLLERHDGEFDRDDDWRLYCMHAVERSDSKLISGADQGSVPVEITLENALTEDDFDDEECLEESLNDFRKLAEQFGALSSIRADKVSGNILLKYRVDRDQAGRIASELGKTIVGGHGLVAKVTKEQNAEASTRPITIILSNILTEEDLEDEDCLDESINDVRELAVQYGRVIEISRDPEGETSSLLITYDCTVEQAHAAVRGFNSVVIAGETVVASLASAGTPEVDAEVPEEAGVEAEALQNSMGGEEGPLFSGGKRISEKFAECKRVPKIPSNGTPRSYASISTDVEMKPLLVEMLGELMRLQIRSMDDKNAKARRRLVIGLREVARGIRARKVKMVVMANNLDDYGAIDEKLQDIIDLAATEDIPVLFELSKRGLGKALGKTLKIAVVGIQNADGANQQFKKLTNKALLPKQNLP